MSNKNTEQIIKSFWMAMQRNDFQAAGEFLHDDYLLEWPQSGERIRGRANFIAVNENYPAHGRWDFSVNRLLTDGNEGVSEVDVSDGVVRARVISFFTIQDGRIISQVEYWPDPFEPADWRKDWVEKPGTKE